MVIQKLGLPTTSPTLLTSKLIQPSQKLGFGNFFFLLIKKINPNCRNIYL